MRMFWRLRLLFGLGEGGRHREARLPGWQYLLMRISCGRGSFDLIDRRWHRPLSCVRRLTGSQGVSVLTAIDFGDDSG